MAKRQNTTALEVNEEAKRMAIAMQTTRLVVDANRQQRRAPARCTLCNLGHLSTECHTYAKEEKMQVAREKHLCLVCLGHKNHHFTKCRLLRDASQLCKHRSCSRQYKVHHFSICEEQDHAIQQQQILEVDPENEE